MLAQHINQKLAPRFYGYFQILKNGELSNKLKLPATSRELPPFHLAKEFQPKTIGLYATEPELPAELEAQDEPKRLSTRGSIDAGKNEVIFNST